MISKETINKIYDAVDIIDVIGDFVSLKKSGSNYKALSPFVDEKSPSFMVSSQKQIFKDFSSGKGGDAVKFIMEHEGFSYPEALRYLAQKYGIEIEEDYVPSESKEQKDDRESLFIVLNYAKNYFTDNLFETDEGQSIGLSYFRERGYTDKTIRDFGLGYALDSWDALYKKATQNQYSVDLLNKAGLIVQKEEENKVFDRFRGRVIFPIHNQSGKSIGFGARILKVDKKAPKYLNSPETEVYNKSKVLYGFYQSKNEIRNKDFCYLVEGYTDVITLHQAGIQNVVASSGTALTQDQIKLIKRFTQNITVLYDGDDAGVRASMRGIDLILEQGLNVKVVLIPDGEDPDSFCKSQGAEKFEAFVTDNAKDFITFKTQYALKTAGNDPLKKAAVITEIVESISKVPDPIKRAVFFQECSRILDINEQVLISAYNKNILTERKRDNRTGDDKSFDNAISAFESIAEAAEETRPANKGGALRNQEREIIRLLLNYGSTQLEEGTSVAHYILREVTDVVFTDPNFQKVFNIFKTEIEAENNTPELNFFIQHEEEDIRNTAVDLATERFELSNNWEKFSIFPKREHDYLDRIAFDTIIRLKWHNIKKLMKKVHLEMKDEKDEDNMIHLQKKFFHLKKIEMSIATILGNVTSGS